MRSSSVVLALVFALSVHAQEWHFRTLAGTRGGGGYRDGAARDARFSQPVGIAACSDAVFIADTGNHAIRRLGADGFVTTWAGALTESGSSDGSRLDARFNGPTGIVADANCTLFVADRGNHTIRKIDPNGTVTTFAGSAGVSGATDGRGSSARFKLPQDLALDGDGTLWVSDEGNRLIRSIASDGTVKKIVTLQAAQTQGSSPLGIAVDSAGIYVADYANRALWKFNRSGTGTRIAQNIYASGVAIGSDGRPYVTDAATQLIQRIEASAPPTTIAGKASQFGSIDGTGPTARFDHPRGIVNDGAGSFLVVDEFGCVVRRVSPEGVVLTVAGTAAIPAHADGTGDVARFGAAYDVEVDSNGVAWVADGTTVRRVARDGTTTTVAGVYGDAIHRDGPKSEARFVFANAIAIEPSGSLVVTDGDTVRRVTADGTVTTIAGVEGANGFVNGDGDVARFGSYLAGIATGPSGVLYVSDTTNHAIRRIEGRTVSTFIAPPFFEVPMGIDTDAAGNVYMWDENVPSIYRITPEGVLTTVAHSDALLYAAQGVAIAPDGALYIGSLRNHSIYRALAGSQTIEHFAGSETSMGNVNGSREETRFRSPGRLDVAPDGRIFVRDANAAIRVASPGVPPEIDSFTADVLAIPEGGRATLSWSTRHGVVHLTPGGEVPATGTLEVQPSETTTYSLTASNEYGEVRRTVTIQAGVRKRRSTRS